MAVAADIAVSARVTGFGALTYKLPVSFSVAGATKVFQKQISGIDPGAEGTVLDLGGITTVLGILITASSKVLDIDTTWDTTFNAEVTIPEGEAEFIHPAGVIYFRENTPAEQPTFEYIVYGT